MNDQRLLRLATRLYNLPVYRTANHKHPHFELENWFSQPLDNECGTAACAVGFACMLPEFKKAGLKLKLGITADGRQYGYPEFCSINGWGAVNAFFDLSPIEATYLFSMEHYPPQATSKVVAKRIRQFVKEGVVPR